MLRHRPCSDHREVSKTQSTAQPIRKTGLFPVEQKGARTLFYCLKEYYHKDSNSYWSQLAIKYNNKESKLGDLGGVKERSWGKYDHKTLYKMRTSKN